MSDLRDFTTRGIETIRAQFPTLSSCTYLNTGTAGPIPRLAHDVMLEEAAFELEEGRGNFATFERFGLNLMRARRLAARLMGAHADEIALTHHTSEGMNIVLSGFDWAPGDVIVTTTLEHDAAVVPLGLLRERRGVEVRFAEIGRGERALEGIERALGTEARLVVLSHIAYSSGALLPIAEIAALARSVGAWILVDGAQTCGAMPLDVHALDVDFYTLSGQKWALGPEGTGALYVRREALGALRPTFTSYFSAERHDFRGEVELHPDARRFETGMLHRPSLAAFNASAAWLLEEVGLARAWRRSLELAALARRRLDAVEGIEIVTPAAQASQLLSFDLPAFSPGQLDALALELASATPAVVIRSTPCAPFCLRASFGFFNTEEDVHRLVDALEGAIARGPDGLKVEGHAAELPDRGAPSR